MGDPPKSGHFRGQRLRRTVRYFLPAGNIFSHPCLLWMSMTESALLPELIALTAQRTPQAIALTSGAAHLSYADLCTSVSQFASGLLGLGLGRGGRGAIYFE